MPKQDPHAVVAVDDATAGVIPNEPIEQDPSKPPPEAVPVEGEATGEEEEEEKPSVPFLELFRYADRIDKACMVVGGVAAAVGGGGMPAFSELFGRLVNNLSGKGGTIDNVEEEVSRLALYMVAVGVAEMIVGFLYVACWMVAAERQTSRMRVRFVESVLRQEPAFHDENKPGALSARLTGDVKVIRAGINDKVGLGIMNFFMFVVGYALGFWRSWKLTLVMLATLPFIAFAGALMDYLMKATAQQSRANFAQAGDVAEEVLSNVKTVQIFGQEEREVARFSSILALARWAGIKKDFFSLSGVGFANAIMFASYALAFWYAGELVKDGDEDVGQVVTVFFSVLMGSFGLGLSLPTLGGLAEARGAAFTLFHMIERPPTIDGDPDVTTTPAGKRIENFRGEVRFEHVKFAYPTRKDTQLFTDLTLTVKAGSVVAFSGASGCGKSSAIALVQRMYDPDSGAVKIDGVDLKDLDLRWWRDQVGIVSQEPNLFSGTIADNVRVGKPDATQEEVETACKQANIHDTVLTLPEQYETDIGSVGSQLSGGQKQRLAIARAIVKNPKFLILDEATSALDRKSEVEVQAALDKIVKQPGAHRTVLVIAHRLATIRNADTIHFVTHDDVAGSVVAESGTYTQLMKKDGEFAHMVSKQSKTLAPPEDDDDELPARSPLRAAKAHTKASPETPQSSKVKGNVSFGQEPGLKEEAAAEVEATEIPMLRLARMTLPQCWAVILGLIGSVVSGGLYPGFSVVFSKVLDVLASRNKQRIEDETKWYAVAFIGLGIICLLAWTAQGFYAFAGEHLTHQLRTMLLRNLLRQDATFFDTPGRDSGSLCGVLAGDCEAVHLLWGPALGYKIQMMANIGVGVVIGLVYEWRVALVTMCGIPLMIIGGAVQQLAIAGFSGTEEEHPEDSIVTESLTNIRTVQAFNHDRRSRDKYALAVQQTEAGGIRTGFIAGCAYGFSQLCIYGVFALSFWYGSTLIDDGKANFNDVMIAAMSILMGAMGAGEAGGFAAKAADAGPAAKRVFALIDRAPFVDVQQQGDADLGPEGAAAIEFDHVKFSYPARPDAKVLRSFSTALPAGHTVGLMGATGCGKSTLLQLLARYYDPLAGSVKVNGKDLRSIDLRTWRQALSVVPQEPALFSGSVVDNIRYGMPEATDAEVREVAKLAAVHEDIERMEQGYETDVGYKGKMLSGGQKQRVAIARGLLRKPRVMLMDEATSALDAATEAKVQDGIMAACRAHPMTVVSVAHRLTTIQHSDRIMLLDNGIVLEQGTHDELMALGGDYKARFDMFQAGTK